MGEVVYVDFTRNAKASAPKDEHLLLFDILTRQGLDEDDQRQIRSALDDLSAYEKLDLELRNIVDIYFRWCNINSM